ncbi:MAG: NAAT family transporter [Caldithrix sp.]|nr:NAAT family transporter [Caldithrix sp.]
MYFKRCREVSCMLDYALLTFTSLFTVINPISIMPAFLALTEENTMEESRMIALRGTAVAFTILILFAIGGNFILSFFNISLPGLKIVGGIIFFIIGYDMLQARISKTKVRPNEQMKDEGDIALTPLGIPLISGPGSITAVILFMKESVFIEKRLMLLLSIVLVLSITYLMLIGARQIVRFIGSNGNKMLLRIMGLIVMVIAVEFFFGGLKPIVRDILMI